MCFFLRHDDLKGGVKMSKLCDMDCFNCKFDDCIKDDVYKETSRYSRKRLGGNVLAERKDRAL